MPYIGKEVKCLYCNSTVWMPHGSPVAPVCPKCGADPERRQRNKLTRKEPRTPAFITAPLTPC